MQKLHGKIKCPCGQVHTDPEMYYIDEGALDGFEYKCSVTGNFRRLKGEG